MRKALTAVCAIAFVAAAASQTFAEQWRPSTNNKVSKCRSVWIGLGDVPHDTNQATREAYFVCHNRFALSHDSATKTPDWVLEHLTRRYLKKNAKRPKNQSFVAEKFVPPYARATDEDYTKPKAPLARGHMAPSDDFAFKLPWLKESFVFSNVVPQIGAKFNGAIWGTLEDQVRAAGNARGEIYVITGPVRGDFNNRSRVIPKTGNACGNEIKLEGPKEAFVCAADNRKPNVFCSKGVAVPIGVFKIVYDPKAGDAYAFLMPNKEYETGIELDEARKTLTSYRVTVAVIEQATGLRFFPALPPDKQDKAVNKCASGTLW